MQPPDLDLTERMVADAGRLGHMELLLERPLVVGVSGGPDSLALLHLLVQLRGKQAPGTLYVAHLDHGIRGQAARDDAEFVRRVSEAWGVPVIMAEVDVPGFARRRGKSLEDAARRARYTFLASAAQSHDAAVAVGHNADDQVETVLMAILRGTGLTGLAGMQAVDAVHVAADRELLAAFPVETSRRVALFRPLLSVWRYEIEDYCRQQGLEPRVDDTNLDLSYGRNRIRHDLIPYLQERYSLAVKDHILRLAGIARSEDEFAAAAAARAWDRLVRVEAVGDLIAFDTAEFSAEPLAMRRRLARMALKLVAGALEDYTFSHIEQAVAVMSASGGAPPAIDVPHGLRVERQEGSSLVRQRGRAQAVAQAECGRPMAGDLPLRVEPGSTVDLEHGWTFETAVIDVRAEQPAMGDWQAAFDYDEVAQIGPLVLRCRAPGDYLRPLGMAGRRRLQDLMVDAKIPRECRAGLAVLAPEGSAEVLWVPGPGGRRSAHAPVTRDTRRVLAMRFTQQDQVGAD
jgi:tRNA(Ile)-lysidine synthase